MYDNYMIRFVLRNPFQLMMPIQTVQVEGSARPTLQMPNGMELGE